MVTRYTVGYIVNITVENTLADSFYFLITVQFSEVYAQNKKKKFASGEIKKKL